jgi:hypothetical protein
MLQFNTMSNIVGVSSTKQYVVKNMQKEGWPNNSTFFCREWDTNLDAWWTHQPEWEASYENDTHYCFSHIHNTEKAQFFRNLYEVQFNGNCSNVLTNHLWGSGWGADFANVIHGFIYAVMSNRPMQMFMTDEYWNYAGINVCPSRDLFCYYLNYSSCVPIPENLTNALGLAGDRGEIRGNELSWAGWAYEYGTRPQTWLRREIYNFTSSFKISTPCTVVHVRRADVGMDSTNRPYYAIKEYFDAAKGNMSYNIFLLTDDQNAIDEALAEYPQYNWMYINRPRFRGDSGGWQNHVPSNDSKHEVVVIESIFRLVSKCERLVHTSSGFANYIYRTMNGAERISFEKSNPNPPKMP